MSAGLMAERKLDMQEDTLSFIAVLLIFAALVAIGGICLAAAVYARATASRVLFTMLACGTVVAFALAIGLLR